MNESERYSHPHAIEKVEPQELEPVVRHMLHLLSEHGFYIEADGSSEIIGKGREYQAMIEEFDGTLSYVHLGIFKRDRLNFDDFSLSIRPESIDQNKDKIGLYMQTLARYKTFYTPSLRGKVERSIKFEKLYAGEINPEEVEVYLKNLLKAKVNDKLTGVNKESETYGKRVVKWAQEDTDPMAFFFNLGKI